MITSSHEASEEIFYKNLEFLTGGMRGIMGVGTYRIHTLTLGKSTQGVSDYLHRCFPNQTIQVVIAMIVALRR